jgi:hypothetical protein
MKPILIKLKKKSTKATVDAVSAAPFLALADSIMHPPTPGKVAKEHAEKQKDKGLSVAELALVGAAGLVEIEFGNGVPLKTTSPAEIVASIKEKLANPKPMSDETKAILAKLQGGAVMFVTGVPKKVPVPEPEAKPMLVELENGTLKIEATDKQLTDMFDKLPHKSLTPEVFDQAVKMGLMTKEQAAAMKETTKTMQGVKFYGK